MTTTSLGRTGVEGVVATAAKATTAASSAAPSVPRRSADWDTGYQTGRKVEVAIREGHYNRRGAPANLFERVESRVRGRECTCSRGGRRLTYRRTDSRSRSRANARPARR